MPLARSSSLTADFLDARSPAAVSSGYLAADVVAMGLAIADAVGRGFALGRVRAGIGDASTDASCHACRRIRTVLAFVIDAIRDDLGSTRVLWALGEWYARAGFVANEAEIACDEVAKAN